MFERKSSHFSDDESHFLPSELVRAADMLVLKRFCKSLFTNFTLERPQRFDCNLLVFIRWSGRLNRRVKEAIQCWLYPNNINRDSEIKLLTWSSFLSLLRLIEVTWALLLLLHSSPSTSWPFCKKTLHTSVANSFLGAVRKFIVA